MLPLVATMLIVVAFKAVLCILRPCYRRGHRRGGAQRRAAATVQEVEQRSQTAWESGVAAAVQRLPTCTYSSGSGMAAGKAAVAPPATPSADSVAETEDQLEDLPVMSLEEATPTAEVLVVDAGDAAGARIEQCCAVCLCEFSEGDVLRLLPCSHTFHVSCIDKWLLLGKEKKVTCPLCNQAALPSGPAAAGPSSAGPSVAVEQPYGRRLLPGRAAPSVASSVHQP